VNARDWPNLDKLSKRYTYCISSFDPCCIT
jgi:hypothetical protein